ncbi:DEAD/DEAH box helicase [uncultured Psychroserpens sp.]|uniref:DEAD/DEAH box helicase n=1 Tax=uncultured Psychroserpens sp. TaxID=255436 RepID=UPI0026089990|nr:DEAD/DEAH box helicase [uncultured Psychroserpens sp.]
MEKSFNDNFKDSILTGFVDKSLESDSLFQPELLVNRKIPRKKVLSTIIKELETCESFYISVAFVTTNGVATLINTFKSLDENGIKGKILVSQYLNFTQPEALKRLSQFKNIELKIITKENSHSKGYIFKHSEYYNLIVGSSNLTSSALSTNKEWNMKVSARNSSSIVNKVINEFESDFSVGEIVNEAYIKKYEEVYKKQYLVYRKSQEELSEELPLEITPNSMQSEALKNLEVIRVNNNKALIISATGTGKTFLAAFDAKAFNPKKLLFVVHRLNIAKKAMETFQIIFGNTKTMGLYSGNKRELDCDFVFSTVQTISKSTHLKQFDRACFDYIIIDESHRSGAESYIRLIDYFQPKFLLGMTATPDRTDGNDIYSLFDHNIAYEIRLSKAMEEDMLIPFHYYGVTDLSVNDEILENESDFRLLTADERVKKIIEKIEFYGSDNGITRGLIFCSKKAEAKELSDKFNQRGYNTVALTGDSSEEERALAIEKLESNNLSIKLDYIFTVDIFNEGIDIPKINQVVMIRPTQSAIIFIQQLGRGLRKTNEKHYLTVIDFIGNYKNNYLIPIALYGDTSFNKDKIRKLISEGSSMIPGESTINFDEITKERIYTSIDSANMQLLTDLKIDYNNLKSRLGRIPMMMDFVKNNARDPFSFVDYSKSYFNFINKVDNTFDKVLDKNLSSLLELFSMEINNSKRIEESLILKELLSDNELSISQLNELIFKKYNYTPSTETIESSISNINFSFIRKEKKVIYLENNSFKFHHEFIKLLENDIFKDFLLDSINYSIYTFDSTFNKKNYKDGLLLFNKYSRKDVCRLLNWENDISSTVYGYRTRNEVTPCFVTYHKSDDIDDTIKYNDHFISPSIFAWESRSNRKLNSPEIQNVINSKRILLFVKKEDAEGTDFYYMGDASIIKNSIQEAEMPESGKPVVHFKFQLEQPVKDDLYNYITAVNREKLPQINLKSEIQLTENVEETTKFRIPLYDFYAAAGSFSEMQDEKEYELINVPERYANDDYFACKVIGESMNKVIPNNSICIFKKYYAGSRSGKILLIENRDTYDPDFNSAFTVKTYVSDKTVTEEGYQHNSIMLKPNSYDKSFESIILDKENSKEMRVIGEFVKVLEN